MVAFDGGHLGAGHHPHAPLNVETRQAPRDSLRQYPTEHRSASFEHGHLVSELQCRCGQFDADLLKRFIRCVGIYPTGTLVKLDSGLLAVVTDQNAKDLVKPRVRAFFSTRQNCYVAPQEIDLSKAPTDRIVSDEDPRKWGVDPNRFLAAA